MARIAIIQRWFGDGLRRLIAGRSGYALLPWLALLAGLTTTGWIWSLTTRHLQEGVADRFLLRAEQLRITLERRLHAHEHVALGAAALFAASARVSREEWGRYVAGVRMQDYYPGLESLAFLQRVPAARKVLHETALRVGGFEDYRIHPPGTRAEYFPTIYLAPGEGFRRVLGFDALTDPVHAGAMELARDMGQPVMSGRVLLAVNDAKPTVPGFVIYAPLYQDGTVPADVPERRQRLRGFVASAFRIPVLMDYLLRDQRPVINVAIHDGISATPDNLLYRHRPSLPPGGLERLEHTVTVTVAGRLWTLRFTPLPRFLRNTASQTPWVVLVAGILVSVMLFLLARGLRASRLLLGYLRERGRELEREIGRRERVEINLQQAKEAAEAASRAKSSFLANVSHELRTPLNGILGYTQILERDPGLAERHRQGLGVIRQSGDYLLTIINDLLDISKVESTHLELYPGDIPLRPFLVRIAESFRVRAGEHGLAFEYHPGPTLPAGIRADEKRLRQLLVNLLSNAVKFTERGTVRFLVERADAECFAGGSRGTLLAGAEPAGDDACWLIRFQVEDSGCGIAPAQFAQLARPFYQVGQTTHKAEGLGLGLALCRELVERMGGMLRLSSEVGRGSVFWVVLPLAVSDAVVAPGESEDTPGHAVGVGSEPLVVQLGPEQAVMLHDLALMGDVSGVLSYLEELEAQGRLGNMASRLRQLAQNFQLEEIAELAQ